MKPAGRTLDAPIPGDVTALGRVLELSGVGQGIWHSSDGLHGIVQARRRRHSGR